MRSLLSTAICLATLLLGISARAEPLAPKLPKPGGWASYHAITKERGRDERIGTLTLKCLARTTVDGTPCRWLESEYLADEGGTHERRKFLVSEQALESNERPLEGALRYLQRDNDRPVRSFPPETTGWMISDFLYFPGFLKNAKWIDEPRTVKYQRGSLDVPRAYSGTYRWQRDADKPAEETTVWETRYRVWLHPELPAGFAHAETTLHLIVRGAETRVWQLDFALQDFGEDAQPAIPEESAPSGTP